MTLRLNSDYWDLDDPVPPKGVAADHHERELWVSVIAQALFDAERGDIYARFWFYDKSGSFHLACHLSGLSASRVRSSIEHMPQLWANQQGEE
jgi:hypothetical protein